jgi:hypothetical protein
MRNILMTVMMLMVVILMFVNIVSHDTTGIREQIELKGTDAFNDISALSP